MDLSPHEKKLAEHGQLTLTDKRIVKQKKTLGELSSEQIPVNRIDSIGIKVQSYFILFLIGIILILIGFVLIAEEELSGFFFLLLGIGFTALFFVLRRRLLFIKSATKTLTEIGKGAEEFFSELETLISKK